MTGSKVNTKTIHAFILPAFLFVAASLKVIKLSDTVVRSLNESRVYEKARRILLLFLH